MTAVPLVAAAISGPNPRRPRLGASNVMRVLPRESSAISTKTPLRREPVRALTTVPEYSASTSTTTSSYGSNLSPVVGHRVVSIRGGITTISYPSRLICSTSIPICSSPRPRTSVFSESDSHFSTDRVTLLSVSLTNRSLTLPLATIVPSCPLRGPLFAPKRHDSVGGASGGVSTARGTLFSTSAAVRVSPTAMDSGTPVRVTMSPAWAVGGSRGARDAPRLANTPETWDVGPPPPLLLDASLSEPSSLRRRSSATSSPEEIHPEWMRPVQVRPR
mmetsp:Transcript_25940/g.62296  ORF Transcript_25940/g.62296 Transcript_25940/m.62296 type:complete len:275 (+) Transcript_25940:457-1281(+)